MLRGEQYTAEEFKAAHHFCSENAPVPDDVFGREDGEAILAYLLEHSGLNIVELLMGVILGVYMAEARRDG